MIALVTLPVCKKTGMSIPTEELLTKVGGPWTRTGGLWNGLERHWMRFVRGGEEVKALP